MSKVKICGITNAQDALWAANLGADFIGLNFYSESPRKVSLKHAKELVSQLPPFLKAVGLFVNAPLSDIETAVRKVPLSMIQLHGDESVEFSQSVKNLGVTVIKVFRLQAPIDPAALAPYSSIVDYFLFDKYSDQLQGGTGEVFDWTWIDRNALSGKPWFLAGGLTPENVEAAIKQTQAPFVDVCSGVEHTPKRKDYEKMKAFIQMAKSIRV